MNNNSVKPEDLRCKETLYLRKHKIGIIKGRGARCKYCDRTVSDLRYEAKIKQRRKGK